MLVSSAFRSSSICVGHSCTRDSLPDRAKKLHLLYKGLHKTFTWKGKDKGRCSMKNTFTKTQPSWLKIIPCLCQYVFHFTFPILVWILCKYSLCITQTERKQVRTLYIIKECKLSHNGQSILSILKLYQELEIDFCLLVFRKWKIFVTTDILGNDK